MMKTFLVKTQIDTVMTQPIVREVKIAQISVKVDAWRRRALVALLEYQDHRVQRVSRDTQEWKAFQDQRETRAILECKAQEDPRETEARWGCQGSLA